MRSARLQGLTLQPAGERLIVSKGKVFSFFRYTRLQLCGKVLIALERQE